MGPAIWQGGWRQKFLFHPSRADTAAMPAGLVTGADPGSAALGVPKLQWKMRLAELGDFYSHLSRHDSDSAPQQNNSF